MTGVVGGGGCGALVGVALLPNLPSPPQNTGNLRHVIDIAGAGKWRLLPVTRQKWKYGD